MDNFLKVLRNLGASRIIAVGAVVIGIMGFFAYLIGTASTPSLSLLYSQVDPSDAAKILERLDAMGVPNEARGDGTQIFVPSDRVVRLRMDLAQDGLPSGGGVGYELFDKTDIFNASGSMIDINRLRALEGELAKTIGTINGINKARVHLVLPKRELFSREKTEPSASIILKMKGMTRLNGSQIQAIQHLVSSAVPQLQKDHVSIVDDKGTLLAKGQDSLYGADGLNNQLDAKVAFETKLSRTVESLIERSLGPGKARVEIAADLDFNRETINSEEYNPDGQVARSISNTGEDSNSNEGSGQPVSAQNALPDPKQQDGKTSNAAKRTEESTNYEISKTIRMQQKEGGGVKRLSVAVLVDGTYVEKDGKPTYTPRSQEDLDKIKLLVKTAVGFKEDRGDKVEVVNMAFIGTDMGDTPASLPESGMAAWMPKMDMTKLIQFSILSVVGLLILMMVVRPMLMKMIEANPELAATAMSEGLIPSPVGSAAVVEGVAGALGGQSGPSGQMAIGAQPGQISQTSGDSSETSMPRNEHLSDSLASSIPDKLRSESFQKVGDVIDKYPEDVVSLLRTWMYEEPWKK